MPYLRFLFISNFMQMDSSLLFGHTNFYRIVYSVSIGNFCYIKYRIFMGASFNIMAHIQTAICRQGLSLMKNE